MILKVGDNVMYRGSWGRDAPVETTIVCIERTEVAHIEDGDEVNEVQYLGGRFGFAGYAFPFVCSLSNGSWGYHDQIKPITKN